MLEEKTPSMHMMGWLRGSAVSKASKARGSRVKVEAPDVIFSRWLRVLARNALGSAAGPVGLAGRGDWGREQVFDHAIIEWLGLSHQKGEQEIESWLVVLGILC